mmetsp:Transcript_53565/g.127379  ORF Transcript_53565/g.127379 Transcript_53565/m.127379 type:complete len:138 (+) Transcript_53565:166-579(+)
MPKKGGKAKKAKEPAFLIDDDTCRPFGFLPNDMVITPLGITVTIIGVKKSEIEGHPGVMWAKFPQGDYNSPLRPMNPEEFEEQGYRRAHQGSHILRDTSTFEVKRQELLDAANPANKGAKAKKGGKKGGKKKGKKKK